MHPELWRTRRWWRRRAGHNRYGNGRSECLSLVLVIHTLELAEAGTSLCRRRNSHLFSATVVDDGVWLFFGHLNLTLSSSSMQINRQEQYNSEFKPWGGRSEEDTNRKTAKNQSDAPTAAYGNETSLPEAARTGNQGPPAPPGRVNDVFWQQFLTQRPGSLLIPKRQILVWGLILLTIHKKRGRPGKIACGMTWRGKCSNWRNEWLLISM